jgi:hypothetical protein
MDVLEDDELTDLLKDSKLIPKYNQEIDRESAYELLTQKIEASEKLAKKEAQKETTSKSTRKSSSSRRSSGQNPFLKVLTSPTVIRSVLGILGKMMR